MHVLGQLRIAVAAALLLAAGNAAALGLGQIQVKSQRNQPLLAEIPIISTTPGELEALQARLASPETFRRVGLAPPTGAAADLQFSLGSDALGRPVIRVTTLKPVDQSVLNFLIEVDWGQGRLVREYTALVDAPRTTSAAVQPAIEAPRVEAPDSPDPGGAKPRLQAPGEVGHGLDQALVRRVERIDGQAHIVDRLAQRLRHSFAVERTPLDHGQRRQQLRT